MIFENFKMLSLGKRIWKVRINIKQEIFWIKVEPTEYLIQFKYDWLVTEMWLQTMDLIQFAIRS